MTSLLLLAHLLGLLSSTALTSLGSRRHRRPDRRTSTSNNDGFLTVGADQVSSSGLPGEAPTEPLDEGRAGGDPDLGPLLPDDPAADALIDELATTQLSFADDDRPQDSTEAAASPLPPIRPYDVEVDEAGDADEPTGSFQVVTEAPVSRSPLPAPPSDADEAGSRRRRTRSAPPETRRDGPSTPTHRPARRARPMLAMAAPTHPAPTGAPAPPPTPLDGWAPPAFGPTHDTALVPWLAVLGQPEVPDTTVDGGDLPGATLRVISCRGFGHRARGTVRQDFTAFGACPDGQRLVIAVADGVSAAPRAELGSRSAARTAVEVLTSPSASSSDTDGRALVEMVAAGIRADGRRSGVEDEELATTLTVAVVDRSTDGDVVWFAGVGDSPAYLLDAGRGTWHRAAPDSGDGPGGGVAALPMDTGAVWSIEMPLSPEHVVLVMSDGLGNPLGPGGGEVGRYLADAWARPPEPYEMLRHVQLRRRTFNDDRSVAAIWRSPR